MGKTYKLVVTDPDQVDNLVEHEISEMEGEALIAKNKGTATGFQNRMNAEDRGKADANASRATGAEANEDKAFSDQMLDTTREPTFEEVKRKKLGY